MTSILDLIQKYRPSYNWPTDSLLTSSCRVVTDSESCTIDKKFRSYFANNVTVTSIKRVESGHLLGMYLLKKAEYGEGVRELSLWHATSEANAMRIIETNLDWRRAQRVKFGMGVSFSPSAYYANGECNRSTPTSRVSTLCKVLVDKTTNGDCSTQLPSGEADTTVGNGRQVYVKYCDNEFYPEYLVYYNSPGRW